MFKISRKRKRQVIGFSVGFFISVVTYVILAWPGNQEYVMKGPMNHGHEGFKCESCHVDAVGNNLQQIQANLMYLFGMRKKPTVFGTEDVDNHKCLDCHTRDNDRHPVHRFTEPRFVEARKNIQPTVCESCHKEHSDGVRITITSTAYCVNCHQETEMKNDPLEVSHAELIKESKWETCLQCHDFHGNHVMHAAESLKDTIPIKVIREYFAGGPSPYSDKKQVYAVKEAELKR